MLWHGVCVTVTLPTQVVCWLVGHWFVHPSEQPQFVLAQVCGQVLGQVAPVAVPPAIPCRADSSRSRTVIFLRRSFFFMVFSFVFSFSTTFYFRALKRDTDGRTLGTERLQKQHPHPQSASLSFCNPPHLLNSLGYG